MKRALALVIASAISVFGCVQVGANNDDGSGGASVCDQQESCASCSSCAQQSFCRPALDACQQDSACTAIDQCVPLCNGIVQCENDCYQNNQAGLPKFNALGTCLFCDACPTNCVGLAVCN
jgi:hypothetical protein